MKNKHLITGAVITMMAVTVGAQQSAPSAPSARSATPQVPPTTTTTTPGAASRTTAGVNDSGMVGSNQVRRFPAANSQALGTNFSAFGTNAFRGTNLSATSDRSMTNRMYGTNGFSSTNAFSATNSTSLQFRDQAFTPADQTLLIQIRQTVRPLFLTGNNRQGLLPVHFIIRDKAVTLVGFVPSEAQKQRVVTLVKQTPGVVDVIDNLQVSANANAGVIGSDTQFSQTTRTESEPVVTQDQAFTSSDRLVLVKVRQAVQPIIGNSSPWMPVHFVAQDGIVTLVGVVPNDQEKQQIFQVVQQTPGVVQVIDRIQVKTNLGATGASTNGFGTSGTTMGVNSTNQFIGTNNIGMTAGNGFLGTNNPSAQSNAMSTASGWLGTNRSFGLTQTNMNLGAGWLGTNNMTPTGRTNSSRIYQDQDQDRNLPPGLRNRENLPPGLQKRNELPPGLQRTNAPASDESR